MQTFIAETSCELRPMNVVKVTYYLWAHEHLLTSKYK